MDFILFMAKAAWSVLKIGIGIWLFFWILSPGKKGGRQTIKRACCFIRELFKTGYELLQNKLYLSTKEKELVDQIVVADSDVRVMSQEEFEEAIRNKRPPQLD